MATERVLKEMRENEEKFVGDLQKIVLLRQKLKSQAATLALLEME